ncbi:VWA-like domain-containing protein [Paenibacillus sp. TRM 82003]|uniref:vWA domain-containing protein n=1 Tax=Kineococcus sp. TRM81007 TaxID=2925831 RepID=UPI001F593554|nr:VWA-like domain-containing protein [Kineococcus sp. TRM81007]MCI2237016.1 VWA-like domain-containing protein [Kineococcus sp. TRM81007]MCI3926588.1 VWA-like domain-containing protein [Paenibacillus sp. TRM 82003]
MNPRSPRNPQNPHIRGEGGTVEERAALRLAAGRARAGELMPYLGDALYAVKAVPTSAIPAAGIDTRWRMYYNPAFVLGLDVAEVVGVWLHEVGHPLRSHHERFTALAEPRERLPLFNRAGDCTINEDLRAAGIRLPPAKAWYPEKVPGAAAGMTAEQIYRLLAAGPTAAGPRRSPAVFAAEFTSVLDDCGSGAGGGRRPWEADDSGRDAAGEDDGSVDAGRAELIRQRTAREVLEHARTRGSVPAGWRRWAERTLTPVVDWRRELLSVTRRVSARVAGVRDYTYARPSRRAAAAPGVVLPAMRQPRPPRVAVVVDTSASVSADMLARVQAETEAVVRRCRGSGVQVIACDAAAGRAQRVRRVQDVELTGGGGTDVRVGIAAAAALRPAVDLVITATDGDTPWPDVPPRENPGAVHVVLLLDGEREGVPAWMRTLVVEREEPLR